jgi:hypothetical protein
MNMKKKATRVNKGSMLDMKYESDLAPKEMRRFGPKYEPRKRGEHEAMPPPADLFERPVYDGAELRPYDGRAGSMTFKTLPSRGLG